MIGPIYATPMQSCNHAANVPLAKPIRVFQFILVAFFFSLITYIVWHDSPFGQPEAAGLLGLAGLFLLVTLVDIVSQCGSDPIPDTPMFLLGMFGTLLFILSSTYLIIISKKDDVVKVWRVLVAAILSIGCALLFILDIVLIFLYGY
ncbi:hypothetical protein TKK_0018307 [Trichogramma kaykai]